MSNTAKELYEAGFALLPYLRASTDEPLLDQWIARGRLSAGERLRKEADEADRKDGAILRFREALVNFAATQGPNPTE